MLTRFTVENFCSIHEKQELNFCVAPEQADLYGWAVPATEKDTQEYPDIATLGILYGANAAGKSKILNAIGVFGFIAYNSQTDQKADEDLPLLSWFRNNEPTIMEAEFITKDGKKIYYKISFTNAILTEKLIVNDKEIFKREENNHIKSEALKTLPFKNLRRNASLLSFAASYEHLKEIHALFQFYHSSLNNSKKSSIQRGQEESFKKAFQRISDLDLGIKDISFLVLPGNEETSHILTNHQLPDGEIKPLIWELESAGTRHLLGIMLKLQNLLEQGGVLLIDEIEEKLHPLAVYRLLSLFNDPKTNPHKAQLICTSHLPDIMEEVAPYNIFLTEKRAQATKIWRLDEDKDVQENQSLREGYLQKIYGGVPRIGLPAHRAN